jgi:hypothetical protein
MRKGCVAVVASVLALLPAAALADGESPGGTPEPTGPPPALVGNSIAAPAPGGGCLACDRLDDCCNPCKVACGPPGRVWVSAEYLLWWIKDSHLPPLVTANATAPLATLATPGTRTLFGGNGLDHEAFSGGRFRAGFWLDECQTIGLEAGYFFLSPNAVRFSAGTAGAPALSRPFFDVLTGMQSAQAVSAPGVLAGTVNSSDSSRLWGAQANAICNVCCGCNYRIDLLGGVRSLSLSEDLNVTETLAVAPNVPTLGGSTFNLRDQFHTENRFYGGLVGARTEYRVGRAFVNLQGAVALGSTHQVVRVNGATLVTPPGAAPSLQQGGLLAQGSNSGRRSRDVFSAVPEVGINAGYQVTNNLRAFVGYSFLYWSNVARPEDQIDLGVNTTQVPSAGGPGTLAGPARPAPILRDSSFWAHGINFGAQLQF